VLAGRNKDAPLTSAEVYDEYGAPEPLRPVVHRVASQKPRATLDVQGKGMKAPSGGSQRVLLQTAPEGRHEAVDAAEFSDTSVKVTLPAAPDGVHLLFVLVNDIAGGQVVLVDGTPPGAPSMAGFTNFPQPTLSGKAEPRSTVQVSLDGDAVGTVQATATGAWSVLLNVPLENGRAYTASAISMDAASNVSQPSTFTFTVDTEKPAAPELNPLLPFINAPKTTLSGTAEKDCTVTVYVDGKVAGTTAVDTAGLWSFSPATELKDRRYTVWATATDRAKNTGPESAHLTFTVDTQAPAAPEVLSPREGDTMDSHTASVSGTAEPGSTVTVFMDGEEKYTAQADSTGAWHLSLPAGLTKGEHTLSAIATDEAGNDSPPTHRTFAVDAVDAVDAVVGFAGGCSGCAAGAGDPSLALLGLAALGRRLFRRRSTPA
jgi:hypothetical protein